MIFDELVLENFGAYRGTNSFELTPPSKEQPIILVGGLNGGGKTTFLDAIQLALYGHRARCASWTSGGYEAFLSECIHRSASPSDGAAVELTFRRVVDGDSEEFRIRRGWRSNGKGVRENVEVWRGGRPDAVVAESWTDFVEELAPLGIAGLFLFDGEKGERLADLENSRDALATAVKSLLGVDIVDQLVGDLSVLKRRNAADVQPGGQGEIDRLRNELDRREAEWDSLTRAAGTANSELDEIRRDLGHLEEAYRSEGGQLFDQRLELEAERLRVQHDTDIVEESLRRLAAGAAPLSLVQDLISTAIARGAAELQLARAEMLSEVLHERDDVTLAKMRDLSASEQLLESMAAFLHAERSTRAPKGGERLLLISPATQNELESLRDGVLVAELTEISGALEEREALCVSLSNVDRKLAAVPEKEALLDTMRRREELIAAAGSAQTRAETLETECERAFTKRTDAESALARAIERQVQSDFASEHQRRVIEHCDRSRATLSRFRTAIVQHHIERISETVLDSFSRVIRKPGLVDGLKIDPETFALTLYRQGRELPAERLSAGERQLLAISLLWGLARSSGRTLPTIIDTPLGRLDSEHRSHLVERYFPHAGHQVVLLSTDQEIHGKYYDALRPFVGREFLLDFDSPSDSTAVRHGYFGRGDGDDN